MPDDRLIHRAYGHSEKVNKLTAFERDVWLVYKLAADDFGVMRCSATPLQDAALWLERQPAKLILKALDAVRLVGLIGAFEHQGQTYVFDPVWQTWQKITHPRQTKQPRPDAKLLDLNTQYLFEHHPKGAKLTSWQHPSERPKAGKTPGKDPESSGNPPGVLPEKTGPVFVGSRSSGVRDRVSGGGEPAAATPTDARSGRPIFKATRFVVFEWQLDDLRRLLGASFEDFDIHQWFFDLSEKADKAGLIVPQRDGGKWLQEQTLAEAERRGLAVATSQQGTGKTAGNAAAAARFVARGQR